MPFRDPAVKAAYELRRYHARRAKAVAMLGGMCVECGSEEALEIDHKDPGEKSFPVGQMWSVAWERFLAEIAKCQLLCEVCHARKTASEQRLEEHGTWGMYRHRKCRCQICRDFFNAYRRGTRARTCPL